MEARWGSLVIPCVAVLGVLFFAPQLIVLAQSLHPNDGITGVGTGWTLENYMVIVSDAYYLATLLRTIWLSAVTAAVCLVVGYPVAYYLARSESRSRGILTIIVIAPLLITIVVRSLGWIILLSNTGPVNFALIASGIANAPVQLIYNQFGVILGLVHAFLPMMILILTSVIQHVDRTLEEAAEDLGASRMEMFRRVLIPLSVPGIAAASILIFAVTTSVYTTTVMLGGGKVLTTPVQIGQEFFMTLNYPRAAALSVVIAAVTFILAVLGSRMSRARYLEAAI